MLVSDSAWGKDTQVTSMVIISKKCGIEAGKWLTSDGNT